MWMRRWDEAVSNARMIVVMAAEVEYGDTHG